jgi:hypothetical protein
LPIIAFISSGDGALPSTPKPLLQAKQAVSRDQGEMNEQNRKRSKKGPKRGDLRLQPVVVHFGKANMHL